MIEINDVQAFLKNEITVPTNIYEHILDGLRVIVSSPNDLEVSNATKEELSVAFKQHGYNTFSDCIGGMFFIAETEEDLLQIKSVEFSQITREYYDVTQKGAAWDSVLLIQKTVEAPAYMELFLATNDAGGNVYFIPEALWEAARIAEHMQITEEFWRATVQPIELLEGENAD